MARSRLWRRGRAERAGVPVLSGDERAVGALLSAMRHVHGVTVLPTMRFSIAIRRKILCAVWEVRRLNAGFAHGERFHAERLATNCYNTIR